LSFCQLRFALRLSYAEQKNVGENDSVDNISRSLDRAREKRDALHPSHDTDGSDDEIEARLSEEKNRRNVIAFWANRSDKKAHKTNSQRVAPLCQALRATEMAAAVVPEAAR